MKIATIDIQTQTYNYLKATQKSLGDFEHIKCTENEELPAIAKKVNEGKYDVVLINIECKYEKANRSDFKGVELIYWLRLKEKFLGTIITYGFLSSAQILRLKPEYVVLHAPGNYHLRLPDEIGSVNKYLEFANIKNIDDYKNYLKPFINIQAIRHASANYYALKKLKNIHKQITHLEIDIEAPEYYTTTELVYDSFFDTNHKDQFKQDAEVQLKGKIEKFGNDILELKELLTQKKGTKGIKQGRAIDCYLYYKEIVRVLNPNSRDYQDRIHDMNKYKILVDAYNNTLNQKGEFLTKLKATLNRNDKEEIAQNRITEIQERLDVLRSLKGKVVLIDDLAEKGWLNFYKELMGSNIDIVTENFTLSKNEFNPSRIAASVINKKPNLVLLDLRLLKGEEKATYPSGIKVLKEMRKLNSIVPIIVCSASNRGSVINLIHQEGANFYWLKEGVDLGMAYGESINNYVRLLHLLKTTLSENQVKLQEMYSRFQAELVNSESSLWWENKDWGYSLTLTNHSKSVYYELIPRITEIKNKTNLLGIVQKGFANYTKLLLKKESQNKLPQWENCASTISLISHILEYVHRVDIIRDNFNKLESQSEVLTTNSTQSANKIISGYTIHSKKGQKLFKSGRFDFKGAALLNLRNKASHFEGAFALTNSDVLTFFNDVLDYLIQPNDSYFDKQHYGRMNFYFEDKECTIKATI